MYGAGDVRVEDVPDPTVQEPTDAVVRVLRSGICGSDLWANGSMPAPGQGRRMDADQDIDDELDAAYQAKYRRYAASIISHIVSPEARSATIKLAPRPTTS